MACKYCGYETAHASNCPVKSAFTAAPKLSTEKKRSTGGMRERYTGTEFEEDMFGSINVRDPEFKAAMEKAGADPRSGHLPYGKAMELVKRFQPGGDPANPKKDYFRELRIAVQEKLGVDTDKEPESVKAYTAVHTPLDRFHGVDAFITYAADGKEFVATLDATLRPEKIQDGGKADFIITDLPSVDEDEDAYLDEIDAMAEKIAMNLRQKRERAMPTAAE